MRFKNKCSLRKVQILRVEQSWRNAFTGAWFAWLIHLKVHELDSMHLVAIYEMDTRGIECESRFDRTWECEALCTAAVRRHGRYPSYQYKSSLPY